MDKVEYHHFCAVWYVTEKLKLWAGRIRVSTQNICLKKAPCDGMMTSDLFSKHDLTFDQIQIFKLISTSFLN